MIAPINPGSSTGWKANHKENGMNMSRKSVAVSGICVTLAILCSGCATSGSQPMRFADLDHFQINCKRRTEQIALLQSMRSTPDDRLFALLSNKVQPWKQFSDPDQYNENIIRGYGRSDWVINQKLMELRDNCRGNP
jgi:hypothetical protein